MMCLLYKKRLITWETARPSWAAAIRGRASSQVGELQGSSQDGGVHDVGRLSATLAKERLNNLKKIINSGFFYIF